MTRRELLATSTAALAVGLSACTKGGVAPSEEMLSGATLVSLRNGLERGQWTSRQLAEFYLNRVMTIDRSGPRLQAVIELNREALELADRMDEERRAGKARGALHGIPVMIKDNIDTADAMKTSAGSLALENWRAPEDAGVVKRLRGAGALILAKTNLSEWANFRSTHSSSGWSGRGGQTLNPHGLRRSPSGSSSGSGAAVAALLCAAALGTETDGSVISPASVNGIVGVKPTVGLLNGAGIVPISHSQDTAGPMTRSVEDAAVLLDVLAEREHESYAKGLSADALKGARIAVARKFFERTPRMNALLDAQVEVLKKAGAEVIDEADLPSHGKGGAEEFEVMLYEFKTDLDAYLGRQKTGVRSMAELIEFNEKHREREMPFFDQEILLQAVKKGPLTEQKYLDARAACLKLQRTEGIDAVLEKYKADAIVAPSSGPAWLIDHANGDYDTGGCTSPAAVAGYPHVTVPAGLVGGLPVGLSFFGAAWSEGKLLRLAYAYEQATKAIVRPAFRADL